MCSHQKEGPGNCSIDKASQFPLKIILKKAKNINPLQDGMSLGRPTGDFKG